MKFIDYKPEHAIEILKGGAKEPHGLCDKLSCEQAEAKARFGPALTGVHDGRIVCCGGIVMFGPGFGEAWGLCVDDLGEINRNLFCREAKDAFWQLIRENELVRVQAPLRTNFPMGEKFVKFFGFEFEARLRKYHPDRTDALMYVIIR